MDSPISSGMFVKVKEWLEKWLLKGHFERSHKLYLERRLLGNCWDELIPGVEFSFRTDSILSNDPVPVSKIAIRNISDNKINHVQLLVVADSYCAIYQQIVDVYNLEQKPCIKKLYDIPVDDVWYDEEVEGILTSYKKIKVRVIKAVCDNNTICENYDAASWRPTHTDILNGEFIRKWGVIYNLNLYKEAKVQLHYKFQDFMFGSVSNAYFSAVGNRRDSKFLTGIKLSLLSFIGNEFFLDKLFWCLFLIKVFKIDDEGNII